MQSCPGFGSHSGERTQFLCSGLNNGDVSSGEALPTLIMLALHDLPARPLTMCWDGEHSCTQQRGFLSFYLSKEATWVSNTRRECGRGTLTHHQLLQKVAQPTVWPKGKHGVWRTGHGLGHH